MIAYIDSSVLLRLILGQRNKLKQWKSIEAGIASSLVELECLRILDRLRLRAALSDEALAVRRETVFRLTEELEMVELSAIVLSRASQPLPTPLGTLDAIHLATALLWRERGTADLVLAAHDVALGLAGQACGLRVVGAG